MQKTYPSLSPQAAKRRQQHRRPAWRAAAAACLVAGTLAAAPAFAAQDLMDVYQQAKQSDPQIKQAKAQYQAAQEAKPQARAGLLPQLNAGAEASRTHQETTYSNAPALLQNSTQDYNTYQYSINLTQPLFRWSTYKRLDQADASVAQAAAQYAAAEQDLMVRVANRYFGVLDAVDRLQVAQAQERAIKRQLEQARQRHEVGLIARTAVEEAKARYDSARADVIAAENAVDSAREALREITGVPMGELAKVPSDIPLNSPKPNDAKAWADKAEEQNWQLTASRHAAEAAMANVGVQRGGHYPTLDLVGSYGEQDQSGGSFQGAGQDVTSATVGIQLNVPIFSGGATSSKVRQAQYQYTDARENLEQVHRSVLRQTADAYRGVESSIQRVKALAQAKVSNKSALDATQAGYEVGTRTIVDVLDAQQNYFQAQRNYQQAVYDYLLNTLNLKQAAGTLGPDDLRAINGELRQGDEGGQGDQDQ